VFSDIVVVSSMSFVGSDMSAVRFFQSKADGSTGLLVSFTSEGRTYCSQTGHRVLSASPGKTSFSPVLFMVDTVEGWVTLSPAMNSAVSAPVVTYQNHQQLTLGQHLQAGYTAFTPRIPLSIIFPLDTTPSSRVHGGYTTIIAPDRSFLDSDILEWLELSDLIRLCLR
jgi:hypothetical protein